MQKSQSIMNLAPYAENIFHIFNGVFGVYKPPREHILQTLHTLRVHLCRDLNKLEVRPPSQHVWIEGETNKGMTVAVGPSYADHTLLVGPRYQLKDVRMSVANNLGTDSSGIMICGIGEGCRKSHWIRNAQPMKFFRLKGIFGTMTDNLFVTGKIIDRAKFAHVRRHHIDKICASMQSSHQRKMFELSGVNIQSQEAYELAVKGPIRPMNTKVPMIYSIKCIDYKPPEFTLEIVCTNENEAYLKSLIHEIAVQVRSAAVCSQVQCVRYGLFTLEHALLKKHWDLQGITGNMHQCRELLMANRFLMKQKDPIFKKYSELKQIESSARLVLESPENLRIAA